MPEESSLRRVGRVSCHMSACASQGIAFLPPSGDQPNTHTDDKSKGRSPYPNGHRPSAKALLAMTIKYQIYPYGHRRSFTARNATYSVHLMIFRSFRPRSHLDRFPRASRFPKTPCLSPLARYNQAGWTSIMHRQNVNDFLINARLEDVNFLRLLAGSLSGLASR